MEYNAENYNAIREACEKRTEFELIASKSATVFSDGKAPDDWTAYPPCMLPPEGYAQVFYKGANDARGTLMKLELMIHLDGGKVFYKAMENELVVLKITWPKD